MSINVTVSNTGTPQTVAIRETGGLVSLSTSVTTGDVSIAVSEARDAYQIAVAEGYTGSRNTWVENLSGDAVSSVFGREGAVVGQSGDYSDTGITNTSNVIGGTVKDAFDQLNTRLEQTGSLVGGATVSSVFGRAGAVIAESGDYSNTGITNESFVLGATTKDALETLSTNIENTGSSLFSLSNDISGALNTQITGLEDSVLLKVDSGNFLDLTDSGNLEDYLVSRIEQTGSATANTVTSVFGRQGIVVGQSGDYSNTGVTNESSVNGATTKDALESLNTYIENTGSNLFSLSNDISGELNFRITGLQDDVLVKSDSGNFLSKHDSGNIGGFSEINSGHLEEYSLQKTDSGNFLNLQDSGNIIQWNEVTSGHLNEYSLQKTDSGNFVDLQDSGAFQSYLQNYISTSSGHIDEYALHKSDSGNFLNLQDSGNIIQWNETTSGHLLENITTGDFTEVESGHLNEYSLHKSDSGNFLDLEDLSNLNTRIDDSGELLINASGELESRLEATGAATLNTVSSVHGRQGAIVGQSGDYSNTGITNESSVVGGTTKDALETLQSLIVNSSGEFLNVTDSGNFLSKHDSGNIGGFSEINSGHLEEYSLQKTDSGNFLDLQDSGAMQSYILGYVSTSSGHLDEYGLHKTDSGNFLDKADSGNIDITIGNTGSTLFDRDFDISGALNFSITGLESRLESTGSATLNTVDSVFGRQGDVVGQSGDYLDTGITNTSNVVGPTVKDAFDTLDSRLTSSGALGGGGGSFDEISSGHLLETNSGFFLSKEDSGNFLDKAGTPVANDYARFTDANTIEGRSYSEVRTDLNVAKGRLGIVIDGAGSAITTGIKADLEVPYDCTINEVRLLADQSGSAVVDIWKQVYSSYPPTNTESITSASPPTLTTATKSEDSTLTGWTTSLSEGDILRFNVDSASTVTRLTVVLEVIRA